MINALEFIPFSAKEYVEWLRSLPVTDYLIPLRGFLSIDEKWQKSPIADFRWKDRAVAEKFTDTDAIRHLERGGWLAIRPKRGYTVVDIDEEEAKQKVLSVYGDTFAVTTRRGCHLYYKTEKRLSGRKPNIVFEKADYQNDDHYVVAPFSSEHRIWNGQTAIQEIPIEFLLPPTAEIQKLWQNGTALYHLRDGDGRNNILFSAGRKLRLYGEANGIDEEEVEKAIYRIGSIFADPLDTEEIDAVIKSVYSTGHREDFSPSSPSTNDSGDEDEPFLGGENPFAVFKPLHEIIHDFPKRDWFLKGICRYGDVVLLAGAPKSGKSTLVRSIAFSCASNGKKPLPVPTGKVLWYMLEEHPADIYEHYERAKNEYDIETNRLLISSIDTGKIPNPLSHWIAGIRDAISSMEEKPVCVIVDTVGRIMSDTDINDYATVQKLLESIRWAIRDLNVVVFLVHHTNKGTQHGITPLGSQAFMGSSDVVMMLDNDDTVSLRITGRNVDTTLFSKPLPLRFDHNTQLYCGIGNTVPAPLVELVTQIHTGKINTLQTAEKWQGGAFKADLRRLLRRGVLICPDGINIYTNKYSKELEKYLFAEVDNEQIPMEQDTNPDGVTVAFDADSDTQKEHIRWADAEADPANHAEACNADYIAGNAELNGSDSDNGCVSGDNERESEPPVHGESVRDTEHEGSAVNETETGHGTEDTRTRTEIHDEINNERWNTMRTTPITESDEAFLKTMTSAKIQASPSWRLLRAGTVPPSLQRVAYYIYTLKNRGALRPSDVDPFSGNELLSVDVEALWEKIRNTIGENHTPNDVTTAIRKHAWEHKSYTLQEAVSVHHAVLAKMKKDNRFFPIMFRGVPFPILACVIRGEIYLVPLTDDDMREGKSAFTRIFLSLYKYRNGEIAPRKYEWTRLSEDILRRGYLFDLYETEDGSKVYVLSPRKYKIETEKDFDEYIFGVVACA